MGEGLPQWLSTLITALGGLGVGGYAVHRKLRADGKSDTLDAKAQLIIERLETQLGTERTTNQHLGDVIDRIAKERNEAVQQVGRLEGTVQALQGEVERMRAEVVKLEKKNTALTEEINAMGGTVRDLTSQIHLMLARFDKVVA
jgi:chromosome segregation ATPase